MLSADTALQHHLACAHEDKTTGCTHPESGNDIALCMQETVAIGALPACQPVALFEIGTSQSSQLHEAAAASSLSTARSAPVALAMKHVSVHNRLLTATELTLLGKYLIEQRLDAHPFDAGAWYVT